MGYWGEGMRDRLGRPPLTVVLSRGSWRGCCRRLVCRGRGCRRLARLLDITCQRLRGPFIQARRFVPQAGHGAGDEMLRQVAARLTQCVRDTDTVARLGGDEFVVVLTDLADTADIDVVAEKILQTLARPIDIQGQEIFVTASIGTSVYPRDGDHGEILLRYADIAMYRSKEQGKNTFQFYASESNIHSFERLSLENSLRKAIERQEFIGKFHCFQ